MYIGKTDDVWIPYFIENKFVPLLHFVAHTKHEYSWVLVAVVALSSS